MRIENKMVEVMDQSDFSRINLAKMGEQLQVEAYIMNRVTGKPQYNDDNSVVEAAANFAAKDAEKKARREKEEKKL